MIKNFFEPFKWWEFLFGAVVGFLVIGFGVTLSIWFIKWAVNQ